MAQKLSADEITARLAQAQGWTLDDKTGEITRTIEAATFPAAILLVSAVGHLAERAGHHPDMLIKYNKVRFALVTHDAGGLTENDFALAQAINGLV
jgi:4a-hydroxytetrahydrobiopterin dehydratase